MRLRPILCVLSLLACAAAAAPPGDRAMALLNAGKRQEALQAFEAIIAAKPADPAKALFFASMIDVEDGNWQAAKPMLERLVKLRPGMFPAWELMIQTYQAAGDTENRDMAIELLFDAWHSALDWRRRRGSRSHATASPGRNTPLSRSRRWSRSATRSCGSCSNRWITQATRRI